jgi:hypothetical protein
MQTVILDIETVPDYSVWTRPEAPKVDVTVCEKCEGPLPAGEPPKCPKMTRGKCRGAKAPADPKDVFPPTYAHRVICAGWLLFTDGAAVAMGAPVATSTGDEGPLLGGLADFLATSDLLVTWAGGRFDLPVLEQRALLHGVPLVAVRRPFWKHTLDLHSELGNDDPKIKLDTLAKLIGLPGKNGVDGSMVEAMAASGNFGDIASYCLHDVVQTAYLYLRGELLRGRLSPDGYRKNCASLRALWEPRDDFKGFKVSSQVELG